MHAMLEVFMRTLLELHPCSLDDGHPYKYALEKLIAPSRTKEEKYGREGKTRKKENYCKHRLMKKGFKGETALCSDVEGPPLRGGKNGKIKWA